MNHTNQAKAPTESWVIDIESFDDVAQFRLLKFAAERAKGLGIATPGYPSDPQKGWFTKEEACKETGVTSEWFDYLKDALFHRLSASFPEKSDQKTQELVTERYLIRADAFMRLVELSALHRAQVQTRWGVYGVVIGAVALVIQTILELLK